MSISINTNQAALTALFNLNSTQAELAATQNTISTGKKINTAKDNGAVWAIANTMQGKVSSFDAVKDSLNRAQSTIESRYSSNDAVSGCSDAYGTIFTCDPKVLDRPNGQGVFWVNYWYFQDPLCNEIRSYRSYLNPGEPMEASRVIHQEREAPQSDQVTRQELFVHGDH